MTERKLESDTSRTPEDVATLYSWANLHGAKYRDFSATRQEQRAQSRHRLLEEQDAMAAEAIRQTIAAQEREVQVPTDAALNIEAPVWAVQPGTTVPIPGTSYADSTQHLAGASTPPPQQFAAQAFSVPVAAAPPMNQQYLSQNFAAPLTPPSSPQQYVAQNFASPVASVPSPQRQYLPQSFSAPAYPQPEPAQSGYLPPARGHKMHEQPERAPQFYQQPEPAQRQRAAEAGLRLSAPTIKFERMPDQGQSAPAARRGWHQQETDAPPAPRRSSGTDTLQQSRERVASRWFALKGVFDQPHERAETQIERRKENRIPTLAIFSLAGGVGKTSMVATLGRALSAHGERLLLADTTTYGLLPFYFGASDVRPGVVRNFSSDNTDEPISVVSLDTDRQAGENPDSNRIIDEIRRDARGTNRILLDMATASGSLTREVLSMMPTVLVPVVPDMNSVVSLAVVDGFFRKHEDSTGRPLRAYYILNQFDASVPLHLDVREVLRQQLGDQLLPFVLRRSPAVSEALAEGMTVIDYAPSSPITEDYMHLADWIRSISAPTNLGARGVRWSER
jgi:cellulose synthase operon protein YhjQ